MVDYTSRRQEEGEWQLFVKGRNKSLKENSKGSNTNMVHGNNQRAIIKGHSNQDIRKNRSNATSFFITNFPKDVTAAMLWDRCKEWGHVVDVYVANKLSKAGKRFGFARFLYVKCNPSLVENLRSIWFGNHRLFAAEIKNNNRIKANNNHEEEEEEEYEEEIPPLDIQIEIMKRLPIKSLLKFMSVSKKWKSVIQSSRFIVDYNARRHIQLPHHFFVGHAFEYYVDIFNDDTSFLQRRLVLPMSAALRGDYSNSLIGYSQGLFGFHFHYHNYKDNVVIWNPSIRKSVFIPVPEHRRHGNYGFTVVCNATEPTIFGITYKPRLQVDIYTLTTGVWRTFSNTLDRESIEFTWKRVAINRFIHWIASDRTPEGVLYNMIVSCDIVSEQFTELSLPPSLAAAAAHTSHNNLHLYELKESLVVLSKDVRKQEIGVWMMMEPGVQNSFGKLYTIKLPYPGELSTVLGFRKDGQPVFQIFDGKPKLLSYEPDLERFNHIQFSGFVSCLADSYTETLLLLGH